MKKSKLLKFSFEKHAIENQPITEKSSDGSRYIKKFINTLDNIGEILKDPDKLEKRRNQYKNTGE